MATEWAKHTVAELRVELKRRGLGQGGKKADLVERLTSADIEESAAVEENATVEENVSIEEGADIEQNTDVEEGATQQYEKLQPPTENEAEDVAVHDQTTAPPTEIGKGSQELPADPVSQTEPSQSPDILTNSFVTQDVDDAGNSREFSRSADNEASDIAMDDAVTTEVAQPDSELASDDRKKRSRSPPPENEEVARKRARNDRTDGYFNGHQSPSGQEEIMPLDDIVGGKDSSYAIVHPEFSEADQAEPRPKQETERGTGQSQTLDDPMDYDTGDVAPAEHPATCALYIKNFMRPLKEQVVRDYLVDLATPRGAAPNPDILVDFYLNTIRTHAFVQFTSVSQASRVRVSLHNNVWPNERNRKELWVDFMPPEMVREWADKEQSEGGRGKISRWEVRYEHDDQDRVIARLVNAEVEPHRPVARPQPSAAPIPTGPARQFPGITGAPLGPRGRGVNYRPPSFLPTPGFEATRTFPHIEYKPVSEELAQRRLTNMRSHYTRDKYRNLGREDEINRYTFEQHDTFVDRGKEVFVGIRPPHRERERRQGGGPRGGPPPFRSGGGRYMSRRDEPARRNDPYMRDDPYRRDESRYDGPVRDVPRSRFNGAPLPTFSGGNSRPMRRGGRRDFPSRY
ncbi:hypothetical protein B0H63DRAFT_557864 [Podospora didyma]|uniref:SAP domain-containing protein n=1 Tax=Podospora didyma TaxID=330526 RepID=A0AAE0P068_9PEZI|nr:hypothetical protein B0H63DRAFT_557864 [Podospora didyma]